MSARDRTLTGVAARIDARIPRPESFTSGLRGPRTTARVGVWLGVAFAVAFATGLYSHASQLATPPVALPTGPSRLYQVTQGLHVAAGTAAVPLLLVKLWSVFPRLFVRPPRPGRALVLHLLERLSIALLVGAAIFQLVTGLANSAQWYPWPFGFVPAHYAVGLGGCRVPRAPRRREAARHPPSPRRAAVGCRAPGIRRPGRRPAHAPHPPAGHLAGPPRSPPS